MSPQLPPWAKQTLSELRAILQSEPSPTKLPGVEDVRSRLPHPSKVANAHAWADKIRAEHGLRPKETQDPTSGPPS